MCEVRVGLGTVLVGQAAKVTGGARRVRVEAAGHGGGPWLRAGRGATEEEEGQKGDRVGNVDRVGVIRVGGLEARGRFAGGGGEEE